MFAKTLVGAAVSLLLVATAASAASTTPNFAGRWKLMPAKSQNLGMMATANITTTIEQTPTELVVDDTGTFGGQLEVEHTTYGLTGVSSENRSPMTGVSTGHSHWEDGRLVTEWERPGAAPGTVLHRKEVRRIEADGQAMVVESLRPGKDPLILYFDRQ